MNTLQKMIAAGAASLAVVAINPVLAAGAAGGATAGSSAGAMTGSSAGAVAGGRVGGETAGTTSAATSVAPATPNGAAGGMNAGVNGGSTTVNGVPVSGGANTAGADTVRSNGSVTGSVDLSAGVPTTASQPLQLTGSGPNALLPAVPTLPDGNANATVAPNGSITGTTAGAATTLPNGAVVVGSNGSSATTTTGVATARPNGTTPGTVDLTTTTDVPSTMTSTTGAQ